MGLYEIMCVKLLKIVKHHRILEILHSVKKKYEVSFVCGIFCFFWIYEDLIYHKCTIAL